LSGQVCNLPCARSPTLFTRSLVLVLLRLLLLIRLKFLLVDLAVLVGIDLVEHGFISGALEFLAREPAVRVAVQGIEIY